MTSEIRPHKYMRIGVFRTLYSINRLMIDKSNKVGRGHRLRQISNVARKKRDTKKTTPLAAFLIKLEKSEKVSTKKLAEIAGCSASVIYDWKDGSMPSETVVNLKKLCNHFGVSLSTALTGAPDEIAGSMKEIADFFDEAELYDGYARIKVFKLIPRKS